MKKIFIILFSVSLILITGCTPANTNGGAPVNTNRETNTSVSNTSIGEKQDPKLVAMSDVLYAEQISMGLTRILAEGIIGTKSIDFKSNEELTVNSYYGKALLNGYITEIESPKLNKNFKFFITVTKDFKVIVRSGVKPDSAVQLSPKPDKYESPYDILN